ncbi:MAG: hypothetical protein O7H41_13580 [Planctomycetota bacterium]|nr:hypothetical protein [Planctomycetota bacterium]
MKTETNRTFLFGFVLTGQDFRCVINTCEEHVQKISHRDEVAPQLSARLKDKSVVETDQLDDICALENFGSKRITRLTMIFEEENELGIWRAGVPHRLSRGLSSAPSDYGYAAPAREISIVA